MMRAAFHKNKKKRKYEQANHHYRITHPRCYTDDAAIRSESSDKGRLPTCRQYLQINGTTRC